MAAGRGTRLRLARLRLDEAIRADDEARARHLRDELDRALAGILHRVTLRAAAAPPPAPVAPVPPAAPRPPARRVPRPGARPGARKPTAAAGSAPVTPSAAPAKPARARRPGPPLPEFWSPGLVLGFRMWELRGRLYGAWAAWDRPEHVARCLRRRGAAAADQVPHTDGRCGDPPCGLYCFKEPEQLLAAFGMPTRNERVVAGLVALSGKVVEHERGYRAQKARVLAAAVVGRGRIVRVEGGARLHSLFAQPEEAIAGLEAADPAVAEAVSDPVRAAEALIAYLTLARGLRLGPGG